MFMSLFTVLFLTSFYYVQAVPYTNCGSEFTLGEVDVASCPGEACYLTIGASTLVSFTIDTGSKYDQISNLSNDVALFLRGTRFNLTVTPENPCEVLTCPITKNYSTTYAATIYVSDEYAPVSNTRIVYSNLEISPNHLQLFADFKWVMQTNSMVETLICFTFPVLLVEA